MRSFFGAGGVRLLAVILSVFSILFAGCGGGNDSSVVTSSSNVATPTKTTLRFAFTQATPQFVVPASGKKLEFKFYSQQNQQGEQLFQATADYAPVVEVANVPVVSKSFLIIVRDAGGLPVAEIRGNLSAQELSSGQVEASGLVNAVTLKTVTLTPATATVALNGTQQYSLRGQFSNGESLTLSAAFASSAPGVASIDAQSGLAKGLANGRVTITATFQQANYTSELLVDEKAPPLALTVFVSTVGDVFSFFSTSTSDTGTFTSADVDGDFDVDRLGNIFHASTGGTALTRIQDRNGQSMNSTYDRSLESSFIFMKGLTLAQHRGVVIGFSDSPSILAVVGVAGSSANTIPMSDVPRAAAYDDSNDRLFVAFQSGRIGVFDNFLPAGITQLFGSNLEPNHVFSASSLNNPQAISYQAQTDTLVVADAGILTGNDPGNNDGKILLFSGASAAAGIVTPHAVISGPDTQLVDAFDIDLQGTELRVVEQNKLLTFSNIFLANGNVAPDGVKSLTGALTVATKIEQPLPPDASDIEDPSTVKGVVVLSSFGQTIARLSSDLSTEEASFDLAPAGNLALSLAVDSLGDCFVPTIGGTIAQLGRLGNGSRDGANLNAYSDFLDRSIFPLFLIPNGIDLVDSRGLILVANDFASIQGYAKNGDGTTVFETSLTQIPKDLDYEPSTDNLYVSQENGTVAIFRNFLATDPSLATPDVTLTIQGATSLSGIVYDAKNDSLLLAEFDHVLVIKNVSSLSTGQVTPDIDITGGQTLLTIPMGIAYDGQNLYVSDFTNGVLRFDNILTSAGGNVAPSAQHAIANPGRIGLIGGFR